MLRINSIVVQSIIDGLVGVLQKVEKVNLLVMVSMFMFIVMVVICFGVWVKWWVVVVGIISREVMISVLMNFIVMLIVRVVISINSSLICCSFMLLINVRFGLMVIVSRFCYCQSRMLIIIIMLVVMVIRFCGVIVSRLLNRYVIRLMWMLDIRLIIISFRDSVLCVMMFSRVLIVRCGCFFSYISLLVSSRVMVIIVQNGLMLSNKLKVMLSRDVCVSVLLK